MAPHPRRQTAEELAAALGRIAPLVTRWIERLLAGHDPSLTLSQYLALQEVAEGTGGGSELARRGAVSPAAVSQLLASLEAAGYVERARASEDRRRNALVLTPAGARMLESADTLVRERLGALFVGIPKPELDALARLLGHLGEPLGDAVPPRRPPPPPRPPRRR